MTKAEMISVPRKELERVVFNMIAAASAYREFAKGDAFKNTRIMDFEMAAELGATMLKRSVDQSSGDKQK